MWPARLSDAARSTVILVAHGSRDARAAFATESLAQAVRRAYPNQTVRVAYLDHAGPRLGEVLRSVQPGSEAIVVPLLLTAAYHSRVDLPAVLAAAADLPIQLTVTDVLGPLPVPVAPLGGEVSPLLVDCLVRRLGGDEPSGGVDAVVLAAAGTRDAAALQTVEQVAAALSVRLSRPCVVAYASAAPPAVAVAVAQLRAAGGHRIALAAYFLAPGRLYDSAAASAAEAGVVAVAKPMTDAPELVRLIAARINAATVASVAAA